MIHQRFKRAVIAAAFGGLSALVVLPTAYAADTLRPEVAKPLNAAQDSYRAHKYQDALAKIAQADAVPNKTPYESYMVEECAARQLRQRAIPPPQPRRTRRF